MSQLDIDATDLAGPWSRAKTKTIATFHAGYGGAIVKIDQFIGMRAKKLRLEKGVQPEKVAIALSLTAEKYSALEMGESKVRAVTMFDLAMFYNMPVTYFLDGYESPSVRGSSRKASS